MSTESQKAYYMQTVTPEQLGQQMRQAEQARNMGMHGTLSGGTVVASQFNPNTYERRVFTDYPSSPTYRSVLWDARVVISKAENGLTLHIGSKQGEEYQTFIARDEQELKELLYAAIVAARLER